MNTPAPALGAAPKLMTYDFPLRPNLVIRFTLPAELSAADAQRVIAFIEALVIA